MKLYRVTFYDRNEGAMLSWHRTKLDAERDLRRQQKERGEEAGGPEGIRKVEIPTDREGLPGWLNAHFNRDNG